MLHNMAYYGDADLTQSSVQSLNELDKANLNAKKSKKLKMKVPSSPIWMQNEAELTSLKEQASASYACLKPVCIKKELGFDTPRMEHSSDQKHSLKSASNQVEQS